MIKNIVLLIAIYITSASCDSQDNNTSNPYHDQTSVEHKIKEVTDHKITVIVYDTCEYIIYKEDKDPNSSYGFMAHKGNCSNPIHCKTE